MNLSLNALIESRGPLQRMMQRPMSAPLAYRFARLVQQVNVELATFNIVHRALAERLDIHPSNEGDEPSENQDEFDAETEALLATEVVITVVPIAIEDLPDLTPADALALQWLVQEIKDA